MYRLGFPVQCWMIILIVVIFDLFLILNGMFLTFASIQFCYRYFVDVFILRIYPFIPSWLRLYHRQLFYQMLWSSEGFFAPFNMLLWSITLINFLILSQSYISSMTPIGLDMSHVLIHCGVQFTNILFSVFLHLCSCNLLVDTCNLLSCMILI